MDDGVHGVLYQGEGDTDALAAAIESLGRLRPDPVRLRRRAERFSAQRFRERIRPLLSPPERPA